MRIKVDEDLPAAVTRELRNRGHDTVSVSGQGMGGWKDPALWDAVQIGQRFLVTADKGFADVRRYTPGDHMGVRLLRPDEDGIRPLLDLRDQLLLAYDLNGLSGIVTVVTPRGIRIRRAART